MILPVSQPGTSSRSGTHTFSLQRSRPFAVLILPEATLRLPTEPVLHRLRSQLQSIPIFAAVSADDDDDSNSRQLLSSPGPQPNPAFLSRLRSCLRWRPSNPQLNPVSFDYVSAFSFDLPARSWTQFLHRLRSCLRCQHTSPQLNPVSSPPSSPAFADDLQTRSWAQFLLRHRSCLRWWPFQPAAEPGFPSITFLPPLSIGQSHRYSSYRRLPDNQSRRLHQLRSTRRPAKQTLATPSAYFEPIQHSTLQWCNMRDHTQNSSFVCDLLNKGLLFLIYPTYQSHLLSPVSITFLHILIFYERSRDRRPLASPAPVKHPRLQDYHDRTLLWSLISGVQMTITQNSTVSFYSLQVFHLSLSDSKFL